jgi:retron-type reverse transcriptase
VRDRVVQTAAKLVLEPILEASFLPCSVVDADFADFFGSLDHDFLLRLVARRVSDRRVLRLIT